MNISHLFQLARVAAFCSGVEVPNTSLESFQRLGQLVNMLTAITTTMQNKNIHPQKNSQFIS